MHILVHLQFWGLAFFTSSSLALTVPQGTSLTNPTNDLHTNSTVNGTNADPRAFTCLKQGPGQYSLPDLADCAGVLRSMPLNPNVGIFYNAGRGDFQLPWFETYKSCQVLVTLSRSYDKVQSSWLAVQVAALELNTACSKQYSLASAYTYIDNLDTMKITFQSPRVGEGADDTGTSATA